MKTLPQIKLAAKEYDDREKQESSRNNVRLKGLVEAYGVEAVSAATGLKLSTLIHYTSRNNAPQIASVTLVKAENILTKN